MEFFIALAGVVAASRRSIPAVATIFGEPDSDALFCLPSGAFIAGDAAVLFVVIPG